MIIKVKILDENGKSKGRAYTYKSEIDVNEGDMVMADMAGKDRNLRVVETDVDPKEIEGINFEIKTIKGLVPEVDL